MDTTGTSIVSGYNSATGVLTLTGIDTVASYRQVLATVEYVNSSLDPDVTPRQILAQVSDGQSNSNVAMIQVQIVPTANLPVLDLDADNSAGQPGRDFFTQFTSGEGPVLIADSDTTLEDPDSVTLQSATARIVNPLNSNSERLLADTSGTSITAYYSSTTGTLSLTGSDTLAHYLQVIRTIAYDNLSHSPDTTTRIVEVSVSDGTQSSSIATVRIAVSYVYVPPPDPGDSDPPPAPESEPVLPDEAAVDGGESEVAADSTGAAGLMPVAGDTQTSRRSTTANRVAAPAKVSQLVASLEEVGRNQANAQSLVAPARDTAAEAATRRDVRSLVEAANTHVALGGQALQSSQIVSPVNVELLSERMETAEHSEAAVYDSVVIGSATIIMTAFTTGYTIWALRGGYLLASVASSLPAWRMIDPLPILEEFCLEDQDDAHDESLESMLKQES